MDSPDSSHLFAWIYGGVMTVVNILLGFIVLPLKGEVIDIRKSFIECQTHHGAKVLHLNEESVRQNSCLETIESDLSEIKERTARTETKIEGLAEANVRIESKLDKLTGGH